MSFRMFSYFCQLIWKSAAIAEQTLVSVSAGNKGCTVVAAVTADGAVSYTVSNNGSATDSSM